MWNYINIIKLLLFLVGTPLDHTDAQHHQHSHYDGQDNFNMGTVVAEAEELPVGLSPWELHVVNDLLVEVMLLKCPNVSRTLARGMKTFITAQVSKAPRIETMNSHFFPVYNNLVKCMDYIDAKKMKKVVPEEKPKESESETKLVELSTFDVTFPPEAVTAEVTVEKENPTSASIVPIEEVTEFHSSPKAHHVESPSDLLQQHEILIIGLTFDGGAAKNEEKKKDKETVVNSEESDESEENHSENKENSKDTKKATKSENEEESILDSASGLVSKIWNKAKNWFSSFGRKKRSVEFGNTKVHHKRRHSKKPVDGNLQSVARKQVHHKFKEVLESLEHVARLSCPQKHRPNHSFTVKAIKEMLYWIGKDFPAAFDAYEKYFLQGYLGLQVQHCLLNESFE